MVEAIVKTRLGETWEAVSAGTKIAGCVHPKAIAVLAEIGIQHEGKSNLADHFRGGDFDQVITVCDDAAENCPVWLGEGQRVHIGFTDPAETDMIADFRELRDENERQIISLLEAYED